jgi:hypothetical protein
VNTEVVKFKFLYLARGIGIRSHIKNNGKSTMFQTSKNGIIEKATI